VDVAVVIPAYRPGPALFALVDELKAAFSTIVVVNDGSGPGYDFSSLPLVLEHAVNLGKGAALKTGINYVLCNFPNIQGIVTADADGQHATEDIIRLASLMMPDSLVLGTRRLRSSIPFRSFVGNTITRAAVRAVVGEKIQDTQTGLRCIPRNLASELLRIPSNGYEFELDMLIAAKHLSFGIRQEPIRTIYLDGNRSSHFNPLLDSMRIYFVLLRFAFVALITALIDNAAFIAIFHLDGSLWKSQLAGRVCAVGFNYVAARRAVFLSHEPHAVTLPKYLALVVANGIVSYAAILSLIERFGIGTPTAKIAVESALFLVNFVILRDFVFKKPRLASAATDWDRYYQSVPFTAKITRKYTTSVLLSAMRRFATEQPRIIEIGGANSCFLDAVSKRIQPRRYHVVDTNQYGLDLLKNKNVSISRLNVLDIRSGKLPGADLVFSIGLIEHFDREGTRKAIEAHFEALDAGGCAIISFPTPTWLYRAARAVCESLGLWKFPDERPLSRKEALDTISKYGEVLYEKTLWPIVFTQKMIVARKIAKTAARDARAG
jgi:glycosyltransferase involved in cell wall biosynthesis